MEPNAPQQVEGKLGEFASKHALTSKTVISALVALIVSVLALFGIHPVDADTQDVIIIITAIVGIYGRYRALRPIHVMPASASKPAATLLLIAAFGLLAFVWLTGCTGRGTRYVESIGFNGSVTRDDVTETTTGTGGVEVRFRDARDPKTIKPLSLRDDVLDEATSLGGPVRIPFRLDVETMDERVEQLVVAPDGVALVVPNH